MAKNKPGAKAPSKAVPVDPSVAVAALPINYKVRVSCGCAKRFILITIPPKSYVGNIPGTG